MRHCARNTSRSSISITGCFFRTSTKQPLQSIRRRSWYTPIGEHRRIIEAAAARGLDVMVEKPLTLSLDDALAIRKAAREHHIQVLVNYETTWYSSNRAVYEMVQQGKLGQIRKVVVHDGHQGPHEIGVQPEFLKWLTDPAENGAGALYDFGCYGADLMTWLMHGEAPLSVTAVAQT